MRLGQLSRKISVRSNEIVSFLSTHGVAIEDSFNARIDDEHVHLVISHFAPNLTMAPLPAERKLEESNVEEPGLPEIQQPTQSEIQPLAEPVSDSNTEISQSKSSGPGEGDSDPLLEHESINEVNGVIKAPKVELQGLKVLGKIELPEPRKKEPDGNSDQSAGAETPSEKPGPGKQRNSPKPRGSQNRPRKNPVALERERRVREQEEQRKRQSELEKQRKAQHYHKRVKPKGPTKPVRIHNEEVAPVEDIQPQPKTLWGRFVKWLTS